MNDYPDIYEKVEILRRSVNKLHRDLNFLYALVIILTINELRRWLGY